MCPTGAGTRSGPGWAAAGEGPHSLEGKDDTHRYDDPVEDGPPIVDSLDNCEGSDERERDEKPPRLSTIHLALLGRSDAHPASRYGLMTPLPPVVSTGRFRTTSATVTVRTITSSTISAFLMAGVTLSTLPPRNLSPKPKGRRGRHSPQCSPTNAYERGGTPDPSRRFGPCS